MVMTTEKMVRTVAKLTAAGFMLVSFAGMMSAHEDYLQAKVIKDLHQRVRTLEAQVMAMDFKKEADAK